MSTVMQSPAESCFTPPFQEEEDFIRERRRTAGEGAGPTEGRLAPLGLALSGGGIRSATFSLGLVQGLAKLGLLKRVDYLSTVSGGGYLGGYFGGLFTPRGEADAFTADAIQEGLKPDRAPTSPVPLTLRWLRENGRYLTPGGSGDGILMMGTVVRNWVAVMAVMSLFVLLAWMTLDALLLTIGWSGFWRSAGIANTVYLSHWWRLLPLPLVGALGAGWAYFMVGYDREAGDGRVSVLRRRPVWLALVTASLAAAGLSRLGLPQWIRMSLGIVLLGCLAALANYVTAQPFFRPNPAVRRTLSRFMRTWLLAALVLAGIAVLDSLGWTLVAHFQHLSGPETPSGGVTGFIRDLFLGGKGQNSQTAAILGALAWILGAFTQPTQGKPSLAQRLVRRFILPVVALLLTGWMLGLLAALAHGLWGAGRAPGSWLIETVPSRWLLFGGIAVVCWLTGQVLGFLNQSTLGPFYTAALTRAYLGASHALRWHHGDPDADRLPGDDIPWRHYRPWTRGGPLPIFNTTLNETTGGRSQVVQRDRKGMNLAVGGAGVSVGVGSHARWLPDGALQGLPLPEGRHRVFPAEPFYPAHLTVGQWVGISGAAVSTGLGNLTSLSTSLLTGLFNVRLGHWWRWGGGPTGRKDLLRRTWERIFPVQARLFEEWIALFPGTASRLWNLTDGGHFENTAVYELVRRRLPLILVSDNGQDSEAKLENLANLVAKARTDFQTEIRFLDDAGLSGLIGTGPGRRVFGTLDQLLDPAHTAIATAAELQYPEGAPGLLVVLKPTLAPDLPLDLRDYSRQNPEFPQQSTGDQFFDERQWESYRKLGEVIALRALGSGPEQAAPWFLKRLDPPTATPAPAAGPQSKVSEPEPALA